MTVLTTSNHDEREPDAVRSTVRTRERRASPVAAYSALLGQVRDEGLLRRRRGFYALVLSALVLGLGGLVTGFVLLGESWFQLLIAGGLGLVLTQVAFLAHEASHRQVFTSGPANDRAGKVLANGVVGISYQWWMTKHSRHHGNPNGIGKDPDIEQDTIIFDPQDAAEQRGVVGWIVRHQGYLFFPLLTLEGFNLHMKSIRALCANPAPGRARELLVVLLRIGLYLGAVFTFLPIGMAFAFVGVQLAVFGVYMGASFAPNHKGMPLVPAGLRIDFLRKQVLTSRNITGGTAMSTLMGGLNYQIEHHLFPSMPRPHLARASEIVKAYCVEHDVSYTETSLVRSYGIVVGYLNRVGLAARDPFECPMVSAFRPV